MRCSPCNYSICAACADTVLVSSGHGQQSGPQPTHVLYPDSTALPTVSPASGGTGDRAYSSEYVPQLTGGAPIPFLSREESPSSYFNFGK